jgi:zinc protease
MTNPANIERLNRKIPPNINSIEQINFIAPEQYSLVNGARLFWQHGLQNNTSKIELHFAAGVAIGDPLSATFCAGLLINGSENRNARQIQNALDQVGAYYDVSLGQLTAVVTIYALNQHLLEAYQIFHQALFSAIFPQKELDQLIRERQEKFKINEQKVSFLAQRLFQKELLAKTNFAKLLELEDFSKAKREDIKTFHEQHYLKGLKNVFLVGDFTPELVTQLELLLNDYRCDSKQNITFEWHASKSAIHLEQNSALQSAIRIGRPLFNKTHPDYLDFCILNTILGDYFGSRLMSNIREDKGFTYGIGSHIVENNTFGYFVIGTEVGVNNRIATFEEIQKEFKRLQTDLVSEEELGLVKSYLLGQLLKSADGPYAMLDLYANVYTYGLDLNFYDQYIKAIKKIEPQRLRSLAQQYLNWDEMLIISAG